VKIPEAHIKPLAVGRLNTYAPIYKKRKTGWINAAIIEILELEPKEEIELIEIKNLLEKSIRFRKKQGAIIFESPNSKIKLCDDKIILTK